MIAESKIKPNEELFTAHLGRYKDKNAPEGQSFFTFGYIDEEVVQSTGNRLWYTPVDDSNGFWQFSSTFTLINGVAQHLPGGSAIADTGTTLALVDDATCKAIYAAIPGSKFAKALGVSASVQMSETLSPLLTVCRATFSQATLQNRHFQT
jgi:hypothetical protein